MSAVNEAEQISAMVGEWRALLEERRDPDRAAQMAAYMKTEMPFFGVSKRDRDKLARRYKKRWSLDDRRMYERAVLAFWEGPERELKYMAVRVARLYKEHIVVESLPLYRRLIVEGAWWDFVDDVAANLVGQLLLEHRDILSDEMRRWATEENIWVVRTAILSQLKHKTDLDEELLYDLCRDHFANETFWIRKAIGWALRQHSYTAPESVIAFVDEYGDQMSGLTRREAVKALVRRGLYG